MYTKIILSTDCDTIQVELIFDQNNKQVGKAKVDCIVPSLNKTITKFFKRDTADLKLHERQAIREYYNELLMIQTKIYKLNGNF